MKYWTVLTSNGGAFYMDEEDLHLLGKWKWHIDGRGYVRRCTSSKGKDVEIHIHKLIMKPRIGQIVDHINGDKLDNTRKNLRLCSVTENLRNRRKQGKLSSSKYKGVTFHKQANRWQVYVQGKYCGLFPSEKMAAQRYNDVAAKVFGDFAKLNKIEV